MVNDELIRFLLPNNNQNSISILKARNILYNNLIEASIKKITSVEELNELVNIEGSAILFYDLLKILAFVKNNCLDEKLENDEKFNNALKKLVLLRNTDSTLLDLLYIDEYSVNIVSDILINNFKIFNSKDYTSFYAVMEFFIPKDYPEKETLLKNVCIARPSFYPILRKYIYEFPGLKETLLCEMDLVNKHSDRYTKEEIEYLTRHGYENDHGVFVHANPRFMGPIIDIQNDYSSTLITKLKKKFWKQYVENFKDKTSDYESDITFMEKILKSNVLEIIYQNKYFDKNDIDCLKGIILYLEYKNINMDIVKQKMDLYREKYALKYRTLYNNFISVKNNEKKLKELIESEKITKDNIVDYVKAQKYWDKTQKNAILLILSKYFELNNYLSVYNIIDILEEMSERNLTKKEILEERGLSVAQFDKCYKSFAVENTELYNLIQARLKENSIRGFKKLLVLYYSIMNSKIETEEEFIVKFKKTPQEVLDTFKSTDFYNDIYNKISTWYVPPSGQKL